MGISIVIRSFNEEAHIGRLLTGIGHQSLAPSEVVLVDSGSTDATVSIAQAFGAKIVRISRDEFSFGRALNWGIDATDCELVVLASAHVYPIYDDWLERLLEPFAEEKVALTYGRQTVPPGGSFSERRLMERWFPATSRTSADDPFCNNANAAIRRELWKQRPYDERLTGLEDLALAREALADGGRIGYVAEAPIVHVHDETFSQVVNRYRREAIAHKAIYPEQTVGWAAAARLFAVNAAGDLAAAARSGQLGAHLAEILRFRFAQFYGTARGFAQSGQVTEALKRRFYYPAPVTAGERPGGAPVGREIDYEEAVDHV